MKLKFRSYEFHQSIERIVIEMKIMKSDRYSQLLDEFETKVF